MHCQNYFLIFSLLILYLINSIKVEDNLNQTAESKWQNYEIKNKDLAFDSNKTSDEIEDTQSNQTINELDLSNSSNNSLSSRSILNSLSNSLSSLFSNSNSSSPISTTTKSTTESEISSIKPSITKSETSSTTESETSSATESEISSTIESETSSTIKSETSSTTPSSTLPTTSSTTPTTLSLTTINKKDQVKRNCIPSKIVDTDLTIVQPNLLLDPNPSSSLCVKREHLNLTEIEAKFYETFDKLDNRTFYTLEDLIDKNYNNVLQIQLQPSSSDSFKMLLNWTKVNQTQTDQNYGILLVLYENQESIIKLFITDQLKSNKTKSLIFNELNHVTYSISLSSIVYFKSNLNDFLRSNQIYESSDKQIYLIKNVFQAMQQAKLEAESEKPISKKSSLITIYTIGSVLLLALICVLLYYRRNKFKSLIKHTSPVYQNSKYLRQKNTPAINISNFENHAFHDAAFEDRFLKNTAQLNCTDRANAFNYRTNRDKLSLSKSNIGRVFEHSVATIKKRTTLKSINPSTVEIDLKNLDSSSRYSQSIPLINFLPLLNELTKTNSRRLFNEFMQLNILSNCSEAVKKSNKVARSSKNIQKNKDGCILPFDHSRVILEQNKFLTSDYINASFIPGISSQKEYIACQCPLKSTIYSFWLMCLQQNVKYVIMTTQLIDSYTTMDQYWPDLFSEDGECMKQIENITIKLRNKRKFQYFILRIFEVKMNDETKVIKHYQLTDWIEIGSQQNMIMLTSFIELFRDEIGYIENCLNDSPIVVHCINGVGKTAIFIAIDRIYVQLKRGKNDYIDIFKTVFEMRQYRPLMIQNEAQYKFVYDCIGHLISRLYPPLVKQMEFDSQLDEINLKDTNDFDTNNNLELNSSFNSQISLFNMLKNSTNRPTESKRLNGYTNQTFVPEKNSC